MHRPSPIRLLPPTTTSRSEDASLLVVADSYARRGWPVLPLKPRDKVPLTSHGLLDASTEQEQLIEWWCRWPEANIGLRTGVAFDVLDIDGPEGADALQIQIGEYRHEGPVSATGKGWHLLFDVTGAKNGAALLPKVDFRGTNGYIVAPPSIHPNGHRYRWDASRGPQRGLPQAPPWLQALLFPPAPPRPQRTSGPNPTINGAVGMLDLQTELAHLGVQLKQKGQRLVGQCPFHQDDTPSLNVYLDNDTFYCFGCQAWGDALNVRHFATTGKLR